jgi:light-regulated signal transduction histidine kinase (bacteriophytochrome)
VADRTHCSNVTDKAEETTKEGPVSRPQPGVETPRSSLESKQLAYAVSHELSQPLTTISGFADLLARRYQDRLDSDGDEFLEFILGAAGRLRCMIEDLAAYIRLGLGAPAPGEVDCSRVVEAVLDSLGSEIVDAEAAIRIEPLPKIRGDAVLIGQLFLNLVSNAIKFSNGSPPRVHVSAEREQGFVRFAVEDNGIGLEPESEERIFELFHRLPQSRDCPGTGAGLAIARKIVEHHGGRIWADPSFESGSRFCFTIPAAPVPA